MGFTKVLLFASIWCIIGTNSLERRAPAISVDEDGIFIGHDSQQSNLGDNVDLADPCPEASAISPCICKLDDFDRLILDCSNISSNEELAGVFLNDFGVYKFFELRIFDNENLTEFGENVFEGVSFESFNIVDTNISYVSEKAFTSSENTVDHIHMHEGFLNDSSFPFRELRNFTNITSLGIDRQSELTIVPLLVSNSLTFFACDRSSVSSIMEGKE